MGESEWVQVSLLLTKLFPLLDENAHAPRTAVFFSFLPSFLPSHCHNSRPQQSGTDNVNNVPLFFSPVLCRGQKRREIKSGRHIKSSAIIIEIIQIAWGGLATLLFLRCDVERFYRYRGAEQNRTEQSRAEQDVSGLMPEAPNKIQSNVNMIRNCRKVSMICARSCVHCFWLSLNFTNLKLDGSQNEVESSGNLSFWIRYDFWLSDLLTNEYTSCTRRNTFSTTVLITISDYTDSILPYYPGIFTVHSW